MTDVEEETEISLFDEDKLEEMYEAHAAAIEAAKELADSFYEKDEKQQRLFANLAADLEDEMAEHGIGESIPELERDLRDYQEDMCTLAEAAAEGRVSLSSWGDMQDELELRKWRAFHFDRQMQDRNEAYFPDLDRLILDEDDLVEPPSKDALDRHLCALKVKEKMQAYTDLFVELFVEPLD